MKIMMYIILAHLLADFVLQSDKLVAKKRDYYKNGDKVFSKDNPLLIHGLYVFGIMQVLHLFYKPTLSILAMTLLITIGHLIIDHLKLMSQRGESKHEKLKFLLDQIGHILVLYLVSLFFSITYDKKYLLLHGSYATISNGKWWIPEIETKLLLASIIFIMFSYVSGYIISLIIQNLKVVKVDQDEGDEHKENVDENSDEELQLNGPSSNGNINDEPDTNLNGRYLSESEKNTGIKIGIIERMLVIIFVVAGQYSAMGLILAGKSLARHEELKDKAFSEYYLYGTLLSFLFGIVGGLIIKAVI